MSLKKVNDDEFIFEWTGGFPKTKEFVLSDMKRTRLSADIKRNPENFIKSNLNDSLPPAFEPVNNKVIGVENYVTENNARNSYKDLCAALSYLGIKNYSLIKGTYKDKHDRDVKLTKLFDPGSQARADLETAKTAGLYVLLTNDPYMRYTMSTGRNWTSCMRMGYSSSRVAEVMEKGNYFVGYMIDGPPKFDDLKSVQGRFVVGLGGARKDVLAEHMLSHQYDVKYDSTHKIQDLIKLLNQVDTFKNSAYKACPICGQKLVKRKAADEKKFNKWHEGRLYTVKNSLNRNFSNILNSVDTKLKKLYKVERAKTSGADYIHGACIPYQEAPLSGALLKS